MANHPSRPEATRNSAPSSIVASRIAVDHNGPLPSLEQVGLADGKRLAFEWQQQRSHARWNDMHGHLSGRPGGRWVLETHGLLGVVAEQVLVAIEAEVEKEICRQALNALPGQPEDARAGRAAHYSRSLRFFSEGQANALVIGLHGLANLVVRSLEFERPLDVAELKVLGIKDPSQFAPGSLAKRAWISLEQETSAALAAFATTRSAASVGLVEELDGIRTDAAVADLLEQRNVHYHRWRGESAGVTGIPLGLQSVTELLAQKQAVGFGPELFPPYSAGDVALEELARCSRSALDALITHMESFRTAWWALFIEAFSSA